MNQKVFLIDPVLKQPWGGGNQFLRSLRDELGKNDQLAETPHQATHFLLNSYQKIPEAIHLKRVYPKGIFVHRLGPIFHLHRGKPWLSMDKIVALFADRVADLVIFQSDWSKQKTFELSREIRTPNVVVGNGVDTRLFFPAQSQLAKDRKIRLISTSWSKNANKGFENLRHLDETLDFNRFSFTFIGNTPVQFKNIRSLPPLSSAELAKQLREHDIFVFSGKDEAASNALIEAIACGLKAVVLDSGGNLEVARDRLIPFTDQKSLHAAIEEISKKEMSPVNSSGLEELSIKSIAQKYCREIFHIRLTNKHLSWSDAKSLEWRWRLFQYRERLRKFV